MSCSDKDWLEVSEDPLSASVALQWVSRPFCGAIVTFSGTVRDHSEGRRGVTSIEYETYREYVEVSLAKVASAARERWPDVGRLALLHRVGRIRLGETSVVVAVSSPHRAEAFDAASFCIELIKQTAPIWKRETWSGGSDWVLCSQALPEGIGQFGSAYADRSGQA
jgi:molybdopterin synthase catalytic subunit